MHLYKGVAPGTHYDADHNDPKRYGFEGDERQPRELDDVVRHVTAHSWPSAWVSVSMSFAVAADYATRGGRVYEIILSRIGAADVTDPIAALAIRSDRSQGRFVHHHDGHQNLTPSLAIPGAGLGALVAFPLRVGAPPTHRGPAPMVSTYLNALVFATRDAELLVSAIPGRAIGNVYVLAKESR